MRVLFATHAERTHFYSMIPLAWALRTAGHEVYVASQPALTDDITQAGLTAVPVGEDHTFLRELEQAGGQAGSSGAVAQDGSVEPPETWEGQGLLYRTFVDFYMRGVNNDAFVAGLVDFARHFRPDLVVWEPYTFAGPVAARAVGAAHARLVFSPDLLQQMRRTFLRLRGQAPQDQRTDPLEPWLGPLLERFGGGAFGEDVTVGQWTIDTVPAGAAFPLDVRRVPMRYVPYGGPAVVPAWLREPPTRPRVCLTGGTSLRDQAGQDGFSIGDLEMFDGLDIELIATLKQRPGRQEPVPDNTRLVDFVPLLALLPSCSAIVHHGGGGTWGTALGAGVPQLLIAESWYALHKGRHLEGAGAGLYVSDRAQSRASLERLLDDPSFGACARRLRDEQITAQPTPGEVVPVLEKLTAHHH
ncbi:activator-dependent family glycosyltransferase [Streptomyces caniscabiei]|uniref:activator-dependent family glycosyltransferase n=1 Tax=Streptomyces caniscabiei TaxID=2746961 RepID=UPI0029A007D1|nr:activator-dependent family glycosyltransferase [Streptomyces caniscabiei]MDX2600832.1 activator-dependent family glycosyltransferase [Streptomyces caniscabiei]MDX2741428.1 activator-dependent family glycosyltransferase [Streptomyces caniscabiei]MDX2781356.1 activator-dependent family glycosyltransferase [Streptomyces caniscabiei]